MNRSVETGAYINYRRGHIGDTRETIIILDQNQNSENTSFTEEGVKPRGLFGNLRSICVN